MRRMRAGLLAALLVLGAGLAPWGEAATRAYVARIVRCTNAAGGASLFSSGPRRAQVRIMNLGTATIFVGQQDGTLSTTTGWPIHATSLAANIVLTNSTAGMNCVTADADSVEVGVLEEIE